MHTLQHFLSDEKHYLDTIDSYIKAFTDKNMPQKSAYLLEHKETIASRLVKAVSNEQFQFKEARQIRLEISQRKKKLFTFGFDDMIVIKTMLAAIAPTFAASCSTHLYSYIKGRSVHQPIADFLKFLEQHKRNNHNKVDLYLHKTDLHHFYETIPVHGNSTIWAKLERLLSSSDGINELPSYIHNLFIQGVRPDFKGVNSNLMTNVYGIPYGSPLSGLLGNLYAQDIDNLIDQHTDMFYCRYSDDILIAHPDKKLVCSVVDEVHALLKKLELSCTTSKERWVYLSKSGTQAANDDLFRGTNSLPYLGCIIHASGKTHSTNRKTKFLLLLCSDLIDKSAKSTEDLPMTERGVYICKQLSQSLLSLRNRLIQQLFLKTNDQNFLAELDKKIAIKLAETLTGYNGVKALRRLSYKKIRDELGLPSLQHLRNNLY